MVEFVFVIVLMFCLSAVLYLMVRALPRIAPEANEPQGLLDRWAHSDIPERIDIALNGFLFKFLRKIKVAILKLDNNLGNHLQQMKAKEDEYEKKSVIDFREIGAERRMEDRRKSGRRTTDRSVSDHSAPDAPADNLPV